MGFAAWLFSVDSSRAAWYADTPVSSQPIHLHSVSEFFRRRQIMPSYSSVIGRWLAGLVLAVLALIGVVSDASAQAVTPSVSSDEIEYHVRQGDTLSDIARRFCSDYRVIARDNRIANPNRIYAGRTVLKFKNGCSLNAPSVLEKQSVSLRELAGNSDHKKKRLPYRGAKRQHIRQT